MTELEVLLAIKVLLEDLSFFIGVVGTVVVGDILIKGWSK